ncbi:hypothetical protein XENTR_v10024998 [Xenopus tropicalis]|nr:hypothetical protein XENTR_v10024998 [Xenopus tropicalis]
MTEQDVWVASAGETNSGLQLGLPLHERQILALKYTVSLALLPMLPLYEEHNKFRFCSEYPGYTVNAVTVDLAYKQEEKHQRE